MRGICRDGVGQDEREEAVFLDNCGRSARRRGHRPCRAGNLGNDLAIACTNDRGRGSERLRIGQDKHQCTGGCLLFNLAAGHGAGRQAQFVLAVLVTSRRLLVVMPPNWAVVSGAAGHGVRGPGSPREGSVQQQRRQKAEVRAQATPLWIERIGHLHRHTMICDLTLYTRKCFPMVFPLVARWRNTLPLIEVTEAPQRYTAT